MSDATPLNRVPSVLFVCVKNGGKSQMAAALMRHHAGEAIEVHSAGTRPGSAVNALSAEAVAELGADMSGRSPVAMDPDLARRVDKVVVLGEEAARDLDDDDDNNNDNDADTDTSTTGPFEVWHTDEPSHRGIEGLERMRLVRDDIEIRVTALISELLETETPQ